MMLNICCLKTGSSRLFSTFGFICALIFVLGMHDVQAKDWIYTTSEGDTLWDFSKKYLHHVKYWSSIQKINNVKNPRKLQINTHLRIPLKWVKVNPIAAKVIALYGTVELIGSENSPSSVVNTGNLIHLGDVLKTKNNSSAAIEFADKSRIIVHENSQVIFDHLTAYGDSGMVDSRLRLYKGRVDSKVHPAVGAGSRFEIYTPSAITAVRGTQYRISSDHENSSSTLEVLEGRVVISAAKKNVLVANGYGSKVDKGKAPIAPRKLLKAPVLNEMPERIRQISWPVRWSKIKSARQYRVEISSEKNFTTIRWGKLIMSNQFLLPELEDGIHYIRIRAVDRLGIEGLNTQVEIIMDVHPQPPILIKPLQNQVLYGDKTRLQWTESVEAENYQLQLSTDEQFLSLVQEQELIQGHAFELTHLAVAKTYYWRVASLARDGEQGPFSPANKFNVKPVPPQPVTELKSDDTHITLTWQDAGPEQVYQVQLAEDPAFRQRLLEDTLLNPELVIAQETLMVRYFRVRVVEKDGYSGAWSGTQKIAPLPDDTWLYFFIPSILLALFI